MSPATMPDQQPKKDLVLNIRKPIGWTSNDLVRFVKRRFTEKVGHAGTLDPFADGVLLVCIGKATKRVPELMEMKKEYRALIELGIETDTLDIAGNITMRDTDFQVSVADVNNVIPQFLGEIEQEPPVFSALRVDGVRAYKLAREGKKVELKKRRVVIYDLEVSSLKGSQMEIGVTCSKGTYIRSLARDMAKALGTCGYVRSLTRTRVGDYTIENADSLIQLDALINT